ncbi:MAG: adenosylcobinamide-phosphate synthase CbiB [Cyanobacteria bacterium P01_D01_bin.73]
MGDWFTDFPIDSLPRAGGLLLLAALLDWMIGDPWHLYHPVQVIAVWINEFTRRVLGKNYSPKTERLAGVALGISTIAGSALVTWLIIQVAHQVYPLLGFAVEVIALASCFAGRSLRDAAWDVLDNLKKSGVEGGRSRLKLYVGRDTDNLNEAEILRATLETVAENAIDGVLAPLFWAIAGAIVFGDFPGIVAAITMAYKAISTLDSTVGYRRSPYTYIGWFSAQFEDRLTWIPCRLSVLTLALWSGKPERVWAIASKDGSQDPSPNSGWSEASYAAALGVQLGGENYYQGEKRIKPLLGSPDNPITVSTIRNALQLTRSAFLSWLLPGVLLTFLVR